MSGAFEQYEHIREAYASYLETAYKIGDPVAHAERAELLRQDGVVSRVPFLETTPRFVPGRFLRDLDHPMVPEKLADLAGLGLTTDKFPLYAHQQRAIESAWDAAGRPSNYVVATGTGSGKTEAFYLPVLADLLRESSDWATAAGDIPKGTWEASEWKHARRLEERPPGIRGVILYPTNALVNDQLRRLRQLLNSDAALRWQHKNLGGNRFYFGRYTGHTQVPGEPSEAKRRRRLSASLDAINSQWDQLTPSLKESGGWPRVGGAEMLSRWDMQAAPPDLLVTNYSMLEYMMVRPIESSIFDLTKEWINRSDDHIFTIVVDEAHTYSGARGTEVAYLIRRLVDRLQVPESQLRCVATSASLGETDEEIAQAQSFVGQLFGRPADSFTIVTGQRLAQEADESPTQADAEAFASYLERSRDSREEALAALAADLGMDPTDSQDALYAHLEKHPAVVGLLSQTAGNATPLQSVAKRLWPDLENTEGLDATAGVLAAGAAVRPASAGEVPPLIPSRIHLMFKGLPGIWACSNEECNAPPHAPGSAAIGKLYLEPRIWCECGARVLELMTCRMCGYMFLGGIGEERPAGTLLWPYAEDMASGLQDHSNYTLLAVSPADDEDISQEWFDTNKGMLVAHDGPNKRPVWTVARPQHDRNHFPRECPQCGSVRSPQREITEDLRTSGQTAFAVLAEDAFRLQPPNPTDEALAVEEDVRSVAGWFTEAVGESTDAVPDSPNEGRKLIVFSDGRQDAAILAGDLQLNHERDTRRQALLAAIASADEELPYRRLREEIFSVLRSRGIDPSFETDHSFRYWAEDRQHGVAEANRGAKLFFDSLLRPDITGREIALETLGLGQWLPRPQADVSAMDLYLEAPALTGLSKEEGVEFRLAAFRILLTENTLAADGGRMDDWDRRVVQNWARKWVVKRPPTPDSDLLFWDPEANNRLVKYVRKVAEVIGQPVAEILEWLWQPPEALCLHRDPDGAGRVIPLSTVSAAKPENLLNLCSACGYVSMHTVFDICLRCRRRTAHPTPLEQVSFPGGQYYRTIAGFARESEELPDPFPLRVLEHTAQIDATRAAERERWFRGQFLQEGDRPEYPLQDRVDALSVTTTMEMGIDIGDLNVVGLRNVPPAVSNYQQRAGRAGRRSSNVALVLTHARDRSHDGYFFEKPEEMITGSVRLPRLHLDNPVIAQRHFNAVLLHLFFSSEEIESEGLFGAFGTVEELRENSYLARIRSLVSHGLDDEFYLRAEGMFADVQAADPRRWASELPELVESAVENAQREAELLEVFITEGLLPRYAFPVDVVAFWTREPRRRAYGEEIQRGMQIALSEFAPGSEIVVDKRIFKSAALYEPYSEQPDYRQQGWYFECQNCQAVAYEDSRSDTSPIAVCPECGQPPPPEEAAQRAIEPPGFATDWNGRGKRYRGGGRERAGFTGRAKLAPGGYAAEGGSPRFEDRAWVSSRTGRLHVVNRGPDPRPGFSICGLCGRVDQRRRSHTRPTRVGDNPPGTQCPGNSSHFNRLVLVHSFQSDVSLLAPVLPDNWTIPYNDRLMRGAHSAWISTASALENAATLYLQIDPGELSAGTRPWRIENEIRAEMFLFDTVPNGAGYARDAIGNIKDIAALAVELALTCPEECATACYRCLLDYGNQFEHPMLNRLLASDLLQFLISGNVPTLSQQRQAAALHALAAQTPADADITLTLVEDGQLMVESERGRGLVLMTHPFADRRSDLIDEAVIAHGIQTTAVDEFDALHRPFLAWAEVFRALALA